MRCGKAPRMPKPIRPSASPTTAKGSDPPASVSATGYPAISASTTAAIMPTARNSAGVMQHGPGADRLRDALQHHQGRKQRDEALQREDERQPARLLRAP